MCGASGRQPPHRFFAPPNNDGAAMENFWVTVRKEIGEHLPADEVEHYAFTAGLNLSFLELTRYLRKRARAASWKLR